MEFEVSVVTTHIETYTVQANNKEEAETLVLEQKVTPQNLDMNQDIQSKIKPNIISQKVG